MQFHPEVTHTTQGRRLLERFVREIAAAMPFGASATSSRMRSNASATQVGSGKVLLGLSGGVDSSVVAALLHRAIGAQLDVRVRRSRSAAPGRRRPGHEHLRRAPGRARHPRRCRGALPRCARRRHGPGSQAQDHRPPVRRGVRRGGAEAHRGASSSRRARSIRTSSSPPAPARARRTSSSPTTTLVACPRR